MMGNEFDTNEISNLTNNSEFTGGKTMIVKDKIASLIKDNGSGQLVPNKTDADWKAQKVGMNILESEYKQREEGDYTKSKPNAPSDENSHVEDIQHGVNDFTHADGYTIDGEKIPTVVSKTTTAVLDKISDGKYYALQVSVNFTRNDAADIESQLPRYTPEAVDLPRGRSHDIDEENKMIYLEPALNGFKLTTLYDSIDPDSWEQLTALRDSLRGYQGSILEETVNYLRKVGVLEEDILKAQAAVGMVPKFRKRVEQILRGKDESGNPMPLTEAVRSEAKEKANELNETLDLKPMTGEVIEIKITVSEIQVSTDPLVFQKWTSQDRSFSYFVKGNVHGRIKRISQEGRKTPIITGSDMKAKIKKNLVPVLKGAVILMENIARGQLGYEKMALDPKVFALPVPSVEYLTGQDPTTNREYLKIKRSLEQQVNGELDKLKDESNLAHTESLLHRLENLSKDLGLSD